MLPVRSFVPTDLLMRRMPSGRNPAPSFGRRRSAVLPSEVGVRLREMASQVDKRPSSTRIGKRPCSSGIGRWAWRGGTPVRLKGCGGLDHSVLIVDRRALPASGSRSRCTPWRGTPPPTSERDATLSISVDELACRSVRRWPRPGLDSSSLSSRASSSTSGFIASRSWACASCLLPPGFANMPRQCSSFLHSIGYDLRPA